MSVPKPGEKRQRSIADMFGGPTPSSILKTKAPADAKTVAKIKATSKKSASMTSQPAILKTPYHRLPTLDLQSLQAGLPEEHRELLELELDSQTGLGPSYLSILKSELTRNYFLDLKRFLKTETQTPIFPAASDIYSWSRRTPLTKIKVVIIGQDPYHGPGQAHGLAFSVPRGIAIPGSLRNIHDELKREYEDFKKPNHGSLGSWADSGVLLLNTSLSVRKGEAGSHAGKGWEKFTDAVVDAIDLYGGLELAADKGQPPDTGGPAKDQCTETDNDDEDSSRKRQKIVDGCGPTPVCPQVELETDRCLDKDVKDPSAKVPKIVEGSLPTPGQSRSGFGKGVVFLCWGKWAADRVARLSDTKHLILKSAHPSPLSAHRGFLGNGHFKLANEWLATRYGPEAVVDWCTLKPDFPANPLASISSNFVPKET